MQDVINRLRTKKADEGFTLIELLVVVVIIGILVAIAVPVYLNYRKGAADKSAQSDVRGAVSTIEQYYTDNNNSYPSITTIVNKSASFQLSDGSTTAQSTAPAGWVTLSDGSLLTYVPGAASTTGGSQIATYKVCATNSNGSGKVYAYDSAVGGSVKVLASKNMTTCA
ncbi:pili assembly chaperone [Paractinoplanes deccanensis]|uniref:Pili assembly chaperone n=1 Tax=Paractinoplanes deccanensis TaxID=113561 RepID=A0ABQ3YFG1_9ACTN|nr:prepilin-type N-terminal cleavage/methylation domain-containing protein [Actinoplanes deccanensis]GID78709.1 pili assembly chaperone [Actinoplanes deccanensis]